MDRVEEEWEKRGSEAPLLRKKPSESMTASNWYFAAEPEESTFPQVLEKIVEDVILFASDCSHWDGGFPHINTWVNRRSDVTGKHKDKIIRGNAIRLYGWAHD